MEDSYKRFAGNIAQKAIIEREGKVLMCRGIGDKVWELPGGRLHEGEVPIEGLVREIKEELGITIIDVKPFMVIPSYHYKSKAHQVYIAYTCTYDGAELKVDALEVEELKWVSISEIKDLPMFDDGKEVLEALMKSR